MVGEWSVWPAPAKVNLFLHVVGRRADGYHELQTAFQLLDYGDWVYLRLREDGRLERHEAIPGVPREQDLALRAAAALQAASGVPLGADVHVEKRLPAGGGLGGGSSDAATVLLALNDLWGADLGEERLAELALQLGADVPVFVRGRSAWAEGVGERLYPLPESALPAEWYLVLDPGASISTSAVFGASELTRDSRPMTMPPEGIGGSRNDCEPVVRARWPEIAAALDWLGEFGYPRLSGTGGCCFVGLADEAQARAALERAPEKWSGFVARAVGRSPLHAMLRATG